MLKLSKDDCRNQVAADYEEDIYAYETAAKRLKASVEQYDWQHSKGPKPVNLSSVIHRVTFLNDQIARPEALAKIEIQRKIILT